MDGESAAACSEFVLGRQAALFRTAFLLTGDRGHAEDLLQAARERTYQLITPEPGTAEINTRSAL